MNATRSVSMLVLCGVAGLVTACQSSSSTGAGGQATASSPVVSTPSAASSVPATGPASTPPAAQPTPTHTSTPGIAQCKKSSLTITVGGQDAATGHRREVLVFTNTGTHACSIFGYPGVAALDAGGAQIEQAARSLRGFMGGIAANHPPTVILAPGHKASAVVEALGFKPNGDACTAYHALLVTVPNDTVSTQVPWGSDGCASLQIHPVVAGTSGDAL